VTLKNKPLVSVATANLTAEQREMYDIYMETQGNKPYLFEGNANVNRGEYTDYDIPPEDLNDARFAAMIEEAEKYLGYPYVWGQQPGNLFLLQRLCVLGNQSVQCGEHGTHDGHGAFQPLRRYPTGRSETGRPYLFSLHLRQRGAGIPRRYLCWKRHDDTLRQPDKLCVGDFKLLDKSLLRLRQIAVTTTKGAFDLMKLDKIEKEMQKTRDKISELQSRLKELGAQKNEQENLQIVSLVRSLDISPGDLKAFLQAAAEQPTPAPVMADSYTGYTTEQEDSDDEE
jgi:hypothetical protein